MALHFQLDQIIHEMLPTVQQFHARRQMAPHAATINNVGAIEGSLLVAKDDQHQLSAPEALAHFETEFRRAAQAGEIVAYAIFYHGVGFIVHS